MDGLVKKIEEKCPDLCILKSERDRFTVDSGCRVELEELPG